MVHCSNRPPTASTKDATDSALRRRATSAGTASSATWRRKWSTREPTWPPKFSTGSRPLPPLPVLLLSLPPLERALGFPPVLLIAQVLVLLGRQIWIMPHWPDAEDRTVLMMMMMVMVEIATTTTTMQMRTSMWGYSTSLQCLRSEHLHYLPAHRRRRHHHWDHPPPATPPTNHRSSALTSFRHHHHHREEENLCLTCWRPPFHTSPISMLPLRLSVGWKADQNFRRFPRNPGGGRWSALPAGRGLEFPRARIGRPLPSRPPPSFPGSPPRRQSQFAVRREVCRAGVFPGVIAKVAKWRASGRAGWDHQLNSATCNSNNPAFNILIANKNNNSKISNILRDNFSSPSCTFNTRACREVRRARSLLEVAPVREQSGAQLLLHVPRGERSGGRPRSLPWLLDQKRASRGLRWKRWRFQTAGGELRDWTSVLWILISWFPFVQSDVPESREASFLHFPFPARHLRFSCPSSATSVAKWLDACSWGCGVVIVCS